MLETVNGSPYVLNGFLEPTSLLDHCIVVALRQLRDERRRLRHEPNQFDPIRLPQPGYVLNREYSLLGVLGASLHEGSEVKGFEESPSASATSLVVVFADGTREGAESARKEGSTLCFATDSGEGVTRDRDLGNERSGDLLKTIFSPEPYSRVEKGFRGWREMKQMGRKGFVDFERFADDLDEGAPQFWIRFFRFGEGFEEIGKRLDHEARVGRHQRLEVVQRRGVQATEDRALLLIFETFQWISEG